MDSLQSFISSYCENLLLEDIIETGEEAMREVVPSAAHQLRTLPPSFADNSLKRKRGELQSSFQISFGKKRRSECELDAEAMAQVKEMVYRAAALRPVSLAAEEVVEKPKRRNVRISSDPQTAAARRRRERISDRLRALQRLVPGGAKMDTASMLDEAANYLKFLKAQVGALERQDVGTSFTMQ